MQLQTFKLGEVSTIVSGTTPDTNNEGYWNGTINWFTPAELDDGHNWYVSSSARKISEKGYIKSSLKMVPEGTVLLTSRAPIGKVAIAGSELCTNQGFKNIICDTDLLNNEFLYFWLLGKKDYLNSLGRGATFKEISKTIVENIEITLPSLEVQGKVVLALTKALELINKRKAQIKALDQLTQSVFLEMFGDPYVNKQNWPMRKVKEITCTEAINGFFAKNDRYVDYGNANVVWIGDFVGNRYVKLDNLKRAIASDEELIKYRIQYGDILFCRSSLNYEGIGKAAYVPRENVENNIIFECHIIKVSLRKELIIPEFFQSLSETSFFRNQIYKNAKTSTMTTISQAGVTECKVVVPPIKMQEEYCMFIQKIESQKQLLQRSLTEMEKNFNSLMQRAFKGELFSE